MTTSNKTTKAKENVFEEEITSVYQIEVRPPSHNMFELDIEVVTEDEQHMLDTFHTQAVAVTGRATIGQLVTTQIGGMAVHTSHMMAQTTEQVQRIETAAQVGRFEKPLQNFNNRLLDDTGRYGLEVNRLVVQQMYPDIRSNIYPDKQPPAPPKRKGVLRNIKEFFGGEE